MAPMDLAAMIGFGRFLTSEIKVPVKSRDG